MGNIELISNFLSDPPTLEDFLVQQQLPDSPYHVQPKWEPARIKGETSIGYNLKVFVLTVTGGVYFSKVRDNRVYSCLSWFIWA